MAHYNKELTNMAIEIIISDAEKRPITLTKLEIERRKQNIHDVMIQQGGGVLNGQIMKIIQLYSTGQLTNNELEELMVFMTNK